MSGGGPTEHDRGLREAQTGSAGLCHGRPNRQPLPTADSGAKSNGALRLGTYRNLWADEVTERNPALSFLKAEQQVELALSDGERLGIADGDLVDVRSNGTTLRARAKLHERMRPGAAFCVEGTAEQNANALAGAETVEVTKASEEAG